MDEVENEKISLARAGLLQPELGGGWWICAGREQEMVAGLVPGGGGSPGVSIMR